MTKTLFAAGASALALIGAATAFAAPNMAPGGRAPMADMTRAQLVQKLDERFAKLDANRDGSISKDEMQAARAAHRDARFASLDTDKNGSLSRAEFDAGKPDGKGGHRGGGHHGRGGGRGMNDSDNNGVVTKAEFTGKALARFDREDADHNGIVTAAERQAAWSAMKARRGQTPQG